MDSNFCKRLLRLIRKAKNSDDQEDDNEDQLDENGDKKISPQAYIENKLLETLKKAFQSNTERCLRSVLRRQF